MNLTSLEKEAMQAVHSDECECGECDAALLVIQWQDLSIGQEKTVKSVCYRKYNVELDWSESWHSKPELSTDGRMTIQLEPDWPVSRIYQVASRMQEAERMILAHDAACFCAECLTKPKEEN